MRRGDCRRKGGTECRRVTERERERGACGSVEKMMEMIDRRDELTRYCTRKRKLNRGIGEEIIYEGENTKNHKGKTNCIRLVGLYWGCL